MADNPIPCFKFEDIEEQLEPLSVVLFRGQGFFSNLIVNVEKLSNAVSPYRFSHCGILVTKDLFPLVKNLQPKTFYVYEMTCSGKIASDETPDIETGKPKFGVQLRDFKSVLQSYPGSIAVLKLKNNPLKVQEGETDDEYQQKVLNIIAKSQAFKDKNSGLIYQLNPIRLLASAIPYLRFLRAFFPFSKFWQMCSQTSIEYLKAVGVVPKKVASENVIPVDFIHDADGELESAKLFELPPVQVIS